MNIATTPMAPYVGLLDSMNRKEKMAVVTFLVSSLPGISIVETGIDDESKQLDEDYMENLIRHSAPAWKGISDADRWIQELRGE